MNPEQPEHDVHHTQGAPDKAAPRDSAAPAEMGPDHESMQHAERGLSAMAPKVAHSHAPHTEDEHAPIGHGGHDMAAGEHAEHHQMSHADHTGHEAMFRRRFWVSLLLSIPVLLYSPTLQALLRF